MVNHRAIHRSQHAVRNVGGTRNLEKMPTRMNQFWFRQSCGVPKSAMRRQKTARFRKKTDSPYMLANPAASFSLVYITYLFLMSSHARRSAWLAPDVLPVVLWTERSARGN